MRRLATILAISIHRSLVLPVIYGLLMTILAYCSPPEVPKPKVTRSFEVATPGGLTLHTTDSMLAARFDWASAQALSYVHQGEDPVGKWYEAALPNREAFCMRDVSHQSVGAHYLGLADHTKNMLFKFAENIAESRDWCSYWEINKDNVPAPVDYANDGAFWYNLPANFDVLIACWKQYLLTGDRDYLDHPVFINFYERTMNDYIDTWDLTPASIMSRDRFINLKPPFDSSYSFHVSRGLPSYGEAAPLELLLGGDLICLQFQAYKVYGNMLKLKGLEVKTQEMYDGAKELSELFNTVWWDTAANQYYSAQLTSGAFLNNPSRYILQSGVYKTRQRLKHALKGLLNRQNINIESQSYLPLLYYQYDENEQAYEEIMNLTAPDKERREYPEVSYAVVEAMLEGVLGISSDAVTKSVMTLPHLTSATSRISFENIPMYDGTINVTHLGNYESIFENNTSSSITWKATFPIAVPAVTVNSKDEKARMGVTLSGKDISQVEYLVMPGKKVRISTKQQN